MRAVQQFVAFTRFLIEVFIERVASEQRVKGVEREPYRYWRRKPEIRHS